MRYINKNYIFIIEDSKEIQNLIGELYADSGYKVGSASNGLEALEILRNAAELPALILLDICMPVMDGFQFRVEQEKDSVLTEIPVVVLTGDINAEVQSIRMGAHGHLQKPFSPRTLFNLVEKYCQH